MKKQKIDNYLEFLKTSQKLKSTLRHSWTEDPNRQESTAEHTWHMALMAISFSPELKNKVDLFKVMKMICIHDLGEAIVGDTPAFSPSHDSKYADERKAFVDIANYLLPTTNKEITELYDEYKKRESPEAIFTKMLDVIDAIFQHLVADISTWSEVEMTFNLNRSSTQFFKEEPFMFELYTRIHDELEEKVKKHKKSK